MKNIAKSCLRLVEVKIPKNLFYNLKTSIINYISQCFNDDEIIISEKKLIKKIFAKSNKLINLTPNGLVVPKKENSLEFNVIIKNYVQILKHFNINRISLPLYRYRRHANNITKDSVKMMKHYKRLLKKYKKI